MIRQSLLATLRSCTSGTSCLLQHRSIAQAVAVDAVVDHAPQLARPLLVPRCKALLVDAAGTLLSPAEPAAQVYLRYAAPAGVCMAEWEVLQRFRRAYNTPWGRSTIRYVGDGKPFWRHIVMESLGCKDERVFEDIYEYYARGEAWTLSPGAVESLQRIRAMGVKTAVVSNFDTRLRRIMKDLGVDKLFDAVVISAELSAEKPNPIIFERACELLGVQPQEAVHVGDDRRNDLFGARDAGCYAWLWGQDVASFADVERRLVTGNYFDSLDGV
ncbi:hypothetical protein N2152v2_010879 [Parachlorella kessleri]